MPTIKSSADLRNNYNEISTYCHNYPEPVFITKNGKGDLAVMSIEAYEELTSRFELYSQIKEGMDDIAAGNTRPFQEAMADIRSRKTAEHDIAKAADYIEFVLKNPQAADHLLDVATEKIGELTQMPEKLRLVDDPVLAVWGIRFIRVNNYLAFYTIDEDKKVVIIVRFLYQKSNWNTILRQGFSLI